MAQLKSAFFCATLKTGTLIIGWLNMVITVIVLALTGVIMGVVDAMIGSNQESMSRTDMDKYSTASTVIQVVVYTVLAFAIFINGCLIYGATKGRRGFMMPFMIFQVIGIGLSMASMVSSFKAGAEVTQVLFNILSFLLNVYFFCIVKSYYTELHPANQAALEQSGTTVQYPMSPASYAAPPTTQYIPVQNKDPFSVASGKEFSQMA